MTSESKILRNCSAKTQVSLHWAHWTLLFNIQKQTRREFPAEPWQRWGRWAQGPAPPAPEHNLWWAELEKQTMSSSTREWRHQEIQKHRLNAVWDVNSITGRGVVCFSLHPTPKPNLSMLKTAFQTRAGKESFPSKTSRPRRNVEELPLLWSFW